MKALVCVVLVLSSTSLFSKGQPLNESPGQSFMSRPATIDQELRNLSQRGEVGGLLDSIGARPSPPYNPGAYSNQSVLPQGLRPGQFYSPDGRSILGNNRSEINPHYDSRTQAHQEQYLYGQCLLDLNKKILKARVPAASEKQIEDYLLESNSVSVEDQLTIDQGGCRALQQFGSEHLGEELLNLVDASGEIIEVLSESFVTPELMAEARQEALACQEEIEETHAIALAASGNIYEGNTPPNDRWEVLQIFEDDETGFYAEIHRELPPFRGEKAKIMLVSRGTESVDPESGELDGRDAFSDATYAFNQFYYPDTEANPNRVDYSDVMERLVPFIRDGHEVVFAGHSLGGALAQGFAYVADQIVAHTPSIDDSMRRNLSSVTFGAFGAGPLIEFMNGETTGRYKNRGTSELYANQRLSSLQQTNYISESDVVPEYGFFPNGQIRELYYNEAETLNLNRNHSTSRMLNWRNSGEGSEYGLASAVPNGATSERHPESRVARLRNRSVESRALQTINGVLRLGDYDGNRGINSRSFNPNFDLEHENEMQNQTLANNLMI